MAQAHCAPTATAALNAGVTETRSLTASGAGIAGKPLFAWMTNEQNCPPFVGTQIGSGWTLMKNENAAAGSARTNAPSKHSANMTGYDRRSLVSAMELSPLEMKCLGRPLPSRPQFAFPSENTSHMAGRWVGAI